MSLRIPKIRKFRPPFQNNFITPEPYHFLPNSIAFLISPLYIVVPSLQFPSAILKSFVVDPSFKIPTPQNFQPSALTTSEFDLNLCLNSTMLFIQDGWR